MTNVQNTVAVVGGGPAGAYLALKLASSGREVLLFDHKVPWEKPCGGMLRSSTMVDFPEMSNYPYPISFCDELVCLSPRNDKKSLQVGDDPIPVVSRQQLGKYLVDLAVASGAVFVDSRVLRLEQSSAQQWEVATGDRTFTAGVVVGADGANSFVRKQTVGRIPNEHLSLTRGCVVSGVPESQFVMKFPDIQGYMWVFSRSDHATAGIGARVNTASGRELVARLEEFLAEQYPSSKVMSSYSAIVPTPCGESFFELPSCGQNWLLVGDAAGHVDSLLGEGLYYAFASASAAAEAILSNNVPSFASLWKESFGPRLIYSAKVKESLASFAEGFGPEVAGMMMYDQVSW